MEQEVAILLDISANVNSEELCDTKARLYEEIILLQALRDEVGVLYLEEFTDTGKPN
jgi:hypothetical protein